MAHKKDHETLQRRRTISLHLCVAWKQEANEFML